VTFFPTKYIRAGKMIQILSDSLSIPELCIERRIKQHPQSAKSGRKVTFPHANPQHDALKINKKDLKKRNKIKVVLMYVQ
jgi:hypothetical protein